jgi:hypothetical protein
MIRDQGTLPFDVNRLEFQVLFDLEQIAPAYSSLQNLMTAAADDAQKLDVMHMETRLLWRVLTKKNWFNALSGHFDGQTPSQKYEQITQRLVQNATVLAKADDNRDIKQESLFMLAKIAIRNGNTKAAMEAFKMAAYNNNTPGQKQAGEKLLVLLKQGKPVEDIDAERLNMLLNPHLQETALTDLIHELAATTDTARQSTILALLDTRLGSLAKQGEATYSALLRAADMAMKRDERDRAERYLNAAAASAGKTTDQARQLALQAELAARRGNHDAQVQYLYRLIALNADKQLDTQARHNLLKALAGNPMATADLVGSAIDATMRSPQDMRTTEGLIITARQLENLALYPAAETYYRQAILLATIHKQTKGEALPIIGRAMLGQARVLLEMDRVQEADAILRTLNTHAEWSSTWPEAAPLWAAIAMRQGLFAILVPGMTELTIQPTEHPRPPPANPPRLLMRATADAVFNRLLQEDAYTRIDQLLSEIEQHSEWRTHLPLAQYRLQALTRMLAKEPAATVMAWMDRQAISTPTTQADELLLSTEALRDWIDKTDRLSLRARTTIL